jgi:outer membrane protein assembly factor BamB
MPLVAALVRLAIAVAMQTTPLDYPQWRGPGRDGGVAGFVAPAAWPEKLTLEWKTDVGEGYATPLVIGPVVYTFTRHGENEVLTALDAGTGRQLWDTAYPAPYTPSAPAAAHGPSPKATPLYHDGRIFTLGVSGILSAFDARTGRQLWHTQAPAEPPFFGAASSPVADGSLIIVHPGNYGPLTAFDAATGAVKWTAGPDGFFMSPIVAELGGVRQAITVTQTHVIGVSLADGTVLWRQAWAGGGSGGTMPVLVDGIVIVSALDAGVAAFKPVRDGGTWSVSTVWTTKDVSMYLSNPVVSGTTLFGFSQRARGQFFALDARTGKTLWLGAPRQATNAAVSKSGDLLFLLDDDGELIVARNDTERFSPIARYTVAGSATWAQPAISGNRIFIKDVSSVTLWTVK